jgi:nucleotide-binding universal stress UspA family protein
MSATAVRRVVVPLDGSPASERALAPAIALTRALDSAIHLVSVVEPEDVVDTDVNDGSTAMHLARNAQEIETLGLAVSYEQRSGEPASELLSAVSPGDLLVITTHGRGAARRWQIGGVAEKLLRQATAPVVLVRADLP